VAQDLQVVRRRLAFHHAEPVYIHTMLLGKTGISAWSSVISLSQAVAFLDHRLTAADRIPQLFAFGAQLPPCRQMASSEV
jgi:hypothetical protein